MSPANETETTDLSTRPPRRYVTVDCSSPRRAPAAARDCQRCTAAMHGERVQQRLLVCVEQVVAPGDERSEGGARPFRSRTVAQQVEPPPHEREQLGEPVDVDTGGRQLDRERQAVQPAADLGHERRRLDRSARTRASPRGRARRTGRRRGRPQPDRASDRGSGSTVTRTSPATCRLSRLVASTWTRGQSRRTASATRPASSSTFSQASRRTIEPVSRRRPTVRSSGSPPRAPTASATRRATSASPPGAVEVDKPDAPSVSASSERAGLDRQPALPDPGRTGQRHEPVRAQRDRRPGRARPPDRRTRSTATAGCRAASARRQPGQGGVLGQDRRLQPAKLRARLERELVGQHTARLRKLSSASAWRPLR